MDAVRMKKSKKERVRADPDSAIASDERCLWLYVIPQQTVDVDVDYASDSSGIPAAFIWCCVGAATDTDGSSSSLSSPLTAILASR